MKQYSKKLFSLVALCSAAITLEATTRISPFLQWRSEGRDTARKLYGMTDFVIYQADMDGCYGTFDATLQYDQTFRGKEIAQALFGSQSLGTDNNVISISGSEATGRGTFDWMAENFYLPRDFRGTLTLKPKVQNILVNFDVYFGLDKWCGGLYFRLYGPVVHTRSGLHITENVVTAGTAANGGYTRGFFDPATDVETNELFQTALSFFGGNQLSYADQTVTPQPLRFAKLADNNATTSVTSSDSGNRSKTQSKTGFAELRGELGWNYIQDRYRVGIDIQAAAPTGTRPNGEFALEAQIGNGKHWELGIGLGGSWMMWESQDAEKSFNFVVEADVTHLFSANQTRTFDLIDKPNSRYMLAQKLASNTDLPDTVKLSGESDGGFQFDNEYAPVANFSTQKVKVSIGAQGDLVAMFNFNARGFSWDLGYNFWAMSTSKIKLRSNNNSSTSTVNNSGALSAFPTNTWALKGDASVAGFYTVVGSPSVTVNLGATDDNANIFEGSGSNLANDDIDNGVDATVAPGGVSFDVNDFTNVDEIETSSTPIFITAANLDLESAETRGLSHKVFTHFSYTWTRSERWLPYLGAGFSAQFGSHNGGKVPSTTATTTNADTNAHSVSAALSNWAVEIKGGISFH